jgi:hypothetical protein
VDPIQPLGHGPLAPIARLGRLPVERAERVSRERDRPTREKERERKRRKGSANARRRPEDPDEERPATRTWG